MPQKKDQGEAVTYICSSCGTPYDKQKGNFYHTKSDLYKDNNHYSNICIKCVSQIFEDIEQTTGSKRMALIAVCHLLDSYYSEKNFNNMLEKDSFTIGKYLNSFNGRQWAGKTFTTNLLQNDFAEEIDLNDDNAPVQENSDDIKNRSYCTSQLGYDPFEESSPKDRKFLFNTLAEYINEDVAEDSHKKKSVVSMVKSLLQEAKIDELIDALLRTRSPNTELLKSYMDARDKCRSSINKTANENGLSEKGSGRSNRGANKLTGIMREMGENKYEDAKVNIFDVKMQGVYKQISDISSKSLQEQLNYQADDFARMVAIQREELVGKTEENEKLAEELRLARIEVKKLKRELGGGN